MRCDWSNTSSLRWKCYVPIHCCDAVSWRDVTKTIKPIINEVFVASSGDIITKGVTVHKIHGSVQYNTVVSRFSTFSIQGWGNWLCCNVGNISVLNHEGEPMDITKVCVCTKVCTMQTKCNIYAGEHLKSFHYKQKVKVKTEWRSFWYLTPLTCLHIWLENRQATSATLHSSKFAFE